MPTALEPRSAEQVRPGDRGGAGPQGPLAAGAGRRALRVARTVGGALLLIAGAAMMVLPGPGVLAVLAGLGLLAPEYPWAHRLLTRLRRRVDAVRPRRR